MPFVLPELEDNPDGWGPLSSPAQFSDLPFAPFEKKAFVGRMADWSARAEQYRERRYRDQRQPQVTNEAFTFQEESQEGFNLVDTQKGPLQQPGWDKGMRGRGRGRGGRFGRGRGFHQAAPMGAEAKFNAKFEKKVVKTAAQSKWKKSMAANNYRRWNDRDPVRRGRTAPRPPVRPRARRRPCLASPAGPASASPGAASLGRPAARSTPRVAPWNSPARWPWRRNRDCRPALRPFPDRGETIRPSQETAPVPGLRCGSATLRWTCGRSGP